MDRADTWHLIRVFNPDIIAVNSAEPDIENYLGTGWVNDPEAVGEVRQHWRDSGGESFAKAAPHLMAAASSDTPVFFFDAEKAIDGRYLDPWNQLRVGSCVGHGEEGAVEDLMHWEIFSGESEMVPGRLSPEVKYALSRVEIGGGRIRGDGSVGAWAGRASVEFGSVVRGIYGALDLTRYDEATCRRLGAEGIPADLERIAKEHPVSAAAAINTDEEAWAAIGTGHPINVCSSQGFSMRLGDDGYCDTEGQWNHSMRVRGRFVHPSRGQSVVIGNSWGDYLKSVNRPVKYVSAEGTKEFLLPGGCFCIPLSTFGRMVSFGDTHTLAGFAGWKRTAPVNYIP